MYKTKIKRGETNSLLYVFCDPCGFKLFKFQPLSIFHKMCIKCGEKCEDDFALKLHMTNNHKGTWDWDKILDM